MDKTDLTNAVPEMALILAAGLGSRLRPQTKTPKPLARVLGLTLAERVVCTLLDAGIRRFLVTLGHEAETVRAHFSDISRRRGVTIDFIEAKDWERGNGSSALAAKGRIGETPFFLVMIDHLFDPEIARALVDGPPAPGEIRLAVDRDKDGIFDLDDVTRVKIDDGRIQEIEKTLDDWDASDVGVMLETARGQRICRGFAIGRAIFGDAAEAWFAGRLDDVAAVSAVAENYDRLVTAWQRACAA